MIHEGKLNGALNRPFFPRFHSPRSCPAVDARPAAHLTISGIDYLSSPACLPFDSFLAATSPCLPSCYPARSRPCTLFLPPPPAPVCPFHLSACLSPPRYFPPFASLTDPIPKRKRRRLVPRFRRGIAFRGFIKIFPPVP